MKSSHFAFVIALGMTVAGCANGPTSQEAAAIHSEAVNNEALARAHKITWVEAAKRDEDKITQLAGNKLIQSDHLLLAYKAALAAEVDAGNITPETAKFRYEEKRSQIAGAEDARREALSGALIAAGANMMQQPRPVTCTSMNMGNMSTATCQ